MFKLVVLVSVAAMAAAKPGVVTVVPAVSSLSQYSSSVLHGSTSVYSVPTVYNAPSVYNSPAINTLSQAPHQSAVVLDAVNGVPVDTPEVVAARATHYTAKDLASYHHLGKRSVAVVPVVYSSVESPVSYSSPVLSTYSAPVVSSYSTPVVSTYL